MAFNRNQNNRRDFNQTPSEFTEDIVMINRISKKTQGGNKVGFAALAVVGDKKGRVGAGHGKAADVASAIRKGISAAKKHLIEVPLVNGTIPFNVTVKVGAAKVMLKPAPKGSGIIAGGAVRSIVSAAGIQNVSSKVLGSDNQASNVYAALEALRLIAQLYKKSQDGKAARKGNK
ncbi:MAG TPA: 30S ribosomal protein S5 [Candidatus Saccharimonadales bacterium]|nr:30S ribosomal protein S5 [Candidatus Saccharimonadales bacterium]